MRQFDWEKKKPPEGLLQIHRNRRRQEAMEHFQKAIKQHNRLNLQSMWNSTTGKHQMVSAILQQQGYGNDCQDNTHCGECQQSSEIKVETPSFARIDQALKSESRQKKERMDQRREIAKRNQADWLRQARSMLEEERNKSSSTHKSNGIEDIVTSKICISSTPCCEELKEAWESQIQEKKASLKATSAMDSQLIGSTSLQSFNQEEIIAEKQKQATYQQREDLEKQIEELEDKRLWEQQQAKLQAKEDASRMRAATILEEQKAKEKAQELCAFYSNNDRYVKWIKEEALCREEWLKTEDQISAQPLLVKPNEATKKKDNIFYNILTDKLTAENRQQLDFCESEESRKSILQNNYLSSEPFDVLPSKDLYQGSNPQKVNFKEIIDANESLIRAKIEKQEEVKRNNEVERQHNDRLVKEDLESKHTLEIETSKAHARIRAALDAQVAAKRLLLRTATAADAMTLPP